MVGEGRDEGGRRGGEVEGEEGDGWGCEMGVFVGRPDGEGYVYGGHGGEGVEEGEAKFAGAEEEDAGWF